MDPDRRGALWRGALRLLSAERGAVFWLPSLLAAAALGLFAMRVAPSAGSLFTHTTSLRIVVVPESPDIPVDPQRSQFEASLRRRLAADGELSVVDSLRAARRFASFVPTGEPVDMVGWLHAARSLNPHVAVRAHLFEPTGPLLQGGVEVWDVRTQERWLACSTAAGSAAALGAALADSVRDGLRRPRGRLAGRVSTP